MQWEGNKFPQDPMELGLDGGFVVPETNAFVHNCRHKSSDHHVDCLIMIFEI